MPCPPRSWRLLGGLSTGVALSVALPTLSMAAAPALPLQGVGMKERTVMRTPVWMEGAAERTADTGPRPRASVLNMLVS